MKEGLSILIPVFNQVCVGMVQRLKSLCDDMRSLNYEILVADDCSTDEATKSTNSKINGMKNCRFIEMAENMGSAATRNALADASQYTWLLFIDSDVEIMSDDYIRNYVDCMGHGSVFNGGIKIGGEPAMLGGNLRFLYERDAEPEHGAEQRNKAPYKSFRSTNFMIASNVFLSCRFDERMRRFEDVHFGKKLRAMRVKVMHIDNPVVVSEFENNADYIRKIELDLRILAQFRDELRGYSRLLTLVETMEHRLPISVIKVWHMVFGKIERKFLTGNRPNLKVFNIYRIGYFLSNQ